MQEYHVTCSGKTYALELPFFVLATQNPIEQEGTYPLPEAQLDRFMFMVFIDYPQKDEEREIVKTTTYEVHSQPQPVLRGRDIVAIQNIVRRVPVSDHVINYAVNLVRATRPPDPTAPQFVKDWLTWGAGPRAAQYLVIGAKARAILSGKYNVSCADIRSVAHPVLRHRIYTNFNADAEGIKPDDIIARLLKTVPEPSAAEYSKSAKEVKAAGA
jgi:MoxR-like ATPase